MSYDDDSGNQAKAFLFCLALSQLPWLYYAFNAEAADELLFITTHTYTFPIAVLLALGVLLFIRSKKSDLFTWGEFLSGGVMMVSATFAATAMGYGLFTDLMDTELWHGCITKIEYAESYEDESCTTDKNGNRDCHCVYHPPQWKIYTNMTGKVGTRTTSISKDEYATIARYWYGTTYLQKEVRTGSNGDITCRIGSVYQITSSTNQSLQLPITLETEFVNYIRASRSVYKIEGSDPAMKSIVPCYPRTFNTGNGNIEINLVMTDTVFKPTDSLKQWMSDVNRKFQEQLRETGPQVKMNPLVFITSQSVDIGGSIVESWSGLKKNDLLIILSVDPKKPTTVTGARTMSLSKHTMFLAELDGKLSHMKQLPEAELFVTTVIKQAQAPGESGFEHLHDSDARYLVDDINLSIWAYLVIVLIALVCNTPITFFFLKD